MRAHTTIVEVLLAQADAQEASAQSLRALAESLRGSVDEEWLSPKEAAAIAKRSPRRLRALGRDGAFEMRGSGRALTIRRSALMQWLDTQPLRRRRERSETNGVEATIEIAVHDLVSELLEAS